MTTTRTPRARRAFTMVEMLVVTTVILVTTAVLVPMMRTDGRAQVMAAAAIIASDLEMAQVRTLANPARPIAVCFDAATASYWLAEAAAPDTPVDLDGDGVPYAVTLGVDRARSATDVTITVTDFNNDTVEYECLGGIIGTGPNPSIRLTSAESWIELAVSPATGRITESAGTN